MATYLASGVDLDAAASWVKKLSSLSPSIGGFGGFYPLGEDFLVASTDGVGTKLKLACALGKHDTIGIDLVAMNVNDVLTSGAKPLFFLDYAAVSKLDPQQMDQILSGIRQGCEESGCLLIGGETAQMPDLYRTGEYDLAGFAVGIVKQKERIDGSGIESGDSIVGLASSGVHSNGFSLVRKIVEEERLNERFEGRTLGEVLLEPTRIYVKRVHTLLKRFSIKGMAHITGGSFAKNLPRMLPKGLQACIREGSWPVPPIFDYLQSQGKIPTDEMRRVFNRGIGFVLVLEKREAERLCANEKESYLIGEVIEGDRLLWQ